MSEQSRKTSHLPSGQRAIRDKCFPPSGTFIEFPKEEVEQSIPERFEKVVRMYPNRLAVKMGDRALTYNELNKAANRIGHAILGKRGPGSEPIALLFEHGIDAIAAIIGVLKADKFFVALEPSLPQERVSFVLKDSGDPLILTNRRGLSLAQSLTNSSSDLLNTDEIDNFVSAKNLGVSILLRDLVNIRYTSGSTGKPKGVIRTHHSSAEVTDQMRVSPDDRFSLLHSLSFGSSAMDFYSSLLNGASLFPFELNTESVQRLASWLRQEQITICHLRPAVFRQLADVLSGAEKLQSLRLIRLSGAPITPTDFDLYKKHFCSGTLLEIGMGSTEAGQICSAVIDQTFAFPQEGTAAGYTHPGKQILLLDENGHEVGPNQVGEIAVKGRGLAVSYWQKPDLTGAKIVSDSNGEDQQIYLTGDLGRMLPDGFLIHLGRKDFVVKIRGYRVEIAEIESAIAGHPDVKDVGVVAWDRKPGEKYVAAYIVASNTSRPTVDELRGFLKEKLPSYMIPSTFVFLDSLPLLNGKLDRQALAKPGNSRPVLSQAYESPHNELERQLVLTWEEVLDIKPVGIHDNFFDLGGHSLAASRIISRIIKTFELDLPIKALFDSPTVANMAVVITQNQAKKASQEDLARLLNEVDALSEEEAQKLLAVESARSSRKDGHE